MYLLEIENGIYSGIKILSTPEGDEGFYEDDQEYMLSNHIADLFLTVAIFNDMMSELQVFH